MHILFQGRMEVTPAMYSHFVNLLSPLAEGKICLIQEVGYPCELNVVSFFYCYSRVLRNCFIVNIIGPNKRGLSDKYINS